MYPEINFKISLFLYIYIYMLYIYLISIYTYIYICIYLYIYIYTSTYISIFTYISIYLQIMYIYIYIYVYIYIYTYIYNYFIFFFLFSAASRVPATEGAQPPQHRKQIFERKQNQHFIILRPISSKIYAPKTSKMIQNLDKIPAKMVQNRAVEGVGAPFGSLSL